MNIKEAIEKTELSLELSPNELLVIANQALGRLVLNSVLFGRSNEIDIKKAQQLINLVTHNQLNEA